MKKLAILAIVLLLLLPASVLLATGKQEAGTTELTLWFPAGEITATSMPLRDGSEPWKAFEAEHDCVINVVAIDYETMKQKVLTALAGGTAPDIGMIDGSWMGQFVKDGALVQIPEADAKKWLAGVSADVKALSDWGGGKMYGYPSWGEDAYALTRNVEMFAEAGFDPTKAPAYLDEFRRYSDKLTVRDGKEIDRVGYAIRHTGHPHGIVDKWDWLAVSSGVKYIDPPTKITGGEAVFTVPLAITSFQKAHDMIYKDRSTSLDLPDPREALLKGLAATQISEVIQQQGERLRAGQEVQIDAALDRELEQRALRLRSVHQAVPGSPSLRPALSEASRASRRHGGARSGDPEDPPRRDGRGGRHGRGREEGQPGHPGGGLTDRKAS